jgi:hypothetical protein
VECYLICLMHKCELRHTLSLEAALWETGGSNSCAICIGGEGWTSRFLYLYASYSWKKKERIPPITQTRIPLITKLGLHQSPRQYCTKIWLSSTNPSFGILSSQDAPTPTATARTSTRSNRPKLKRLT